VAEDASEDGVYSGERRCERGVRDDLGLEQDGKKKEGGRSA
jgi:hypothetical protein